MQNYQLYSLYTSNVDLCQFFYFFQTMVTEDMLERYIQLEEEIALAEKNSPSMVLQQKRSQVQQLARRIAEQQELVKALEAET